jgi:hypothetical protein
MSIRRAFGVHKAAVLLVFGFAFLCPVVSAQIIKAPTVEIFGGYSYLRFDGTPLGFPGSLNLHGGNFEIAIPNVYRDFGIVVDVSGHYSNQLEEFNFLIGGQYKFEAKGLHFYGHALGGRARTRLENVGASQIGPSSLGGAGMLGGGIEFPWKDRIMFRPVQADYLISGAFAEKFNSLRISTGIVFQFGKRPTKTPSL